jgi:hypothetical protein
MEHWPAPPLTNRPGWGRIGPFPRGKEGGIPLSTLRLRAVVIGLLLLVLVSFVTVYADLVIKQIQIGILQFAPAAVGMLLIVVVVNRLLRRVARRFLLSASDVFIIYAMLLIGTLLSSRGLVEKLIPSLVALNYYATEENRWREMFYHNIPPWLVAFDPRGGLKQDVARDFYEGLHDGEPIPWGRWLPPLVCWGGMVGCVLGSVPLPLLVAAAPVGGE